MECSGCFVGAGLGIEWVGRVKKLTGLGSICTYGESDHVNAQVFGRGTG